MKIYFEYSGRAVKSHRESISLIYDTLKQMGHTHVYDTLRHLEESDDAKSHGDEINLYKAAIRSIDQCEVLVLEISTNSLSMGFLMQRALSTGKPVIALHLKDNHPLFAAGNEDEKLQIVEYNKENIATQLKTALDYASAQSDVRFNFFISPTIGQYLDFISKTKKIPRSVYLRRLIETDMETNTEYDSKNS